MKCSLPNDHIKANFIILCFHRLRLYARMNFTQISTFRAVMTSDSLSDAAVKLGRTQPAVSAAIKALEEQLGLQLFERRGRKLIPMPEAQYLLAEADEILSQMGRVRQTMRSLSVGKSGTLNVAVMPGPVSQLFPKFLASRLDRSGEVSVSLQARTSNQIAELTRAQSVDFAFADAPEDADGDTLFEAEIIAADCMVALPVDHRLAELDKIRVSDLDAEPIGTLHSPHAHARAVAKAFDTAGSSLRKMVDSQTFLPLLHFVAAGQCCTIVDPLSVFFADGEEAMVKGVAVRPMADPIRYEYGLFSPRYRPISLLARELRDAWRSEVMRLLHSVGSRPTCEGADSSGEA